MSVSVSVGKARFNLSWPVPTNPLSAVKLDDLAQIKPFWDVKKTFKDPRIKGFPQDKVNTNKVKTYQPYSWTYMMDSPYELI